MKDKLLKNNKTPLFFILKKVSIVSVVTLAFSLATIAPFKAVQSEILKLHAQQKEETSEESSIPLEEIDNALFHY